MNTDIPNCYYRVSIKALILNENKKFLLCKEPDGRWELPGGGLDFNENPQNWIKREIHEDMGLIVTSVAKNPSYFLTDNGTHGIWRAKVLYLTTVNNLNFTSSDECIAIKFFSVAEAARENLLSNVKKFLKLYDPNNH